MNEVESVAIDQSKKSPADFRVAANYSPIAYIPQVLAILLGRMLNLSVLHLLWLARLAGLLVFVAAGFFALKLIPGRKWLYALLLCLPMSLYISSSVSADNMIKSSAILLIALVLWLREERSRLNNWKYILALAVLTIILAASKQVYLPLALSPVILLFDRKIWHDHKKRLTLLGVLGLTIIAWSIWMVLVQKEHVPPLNPGDGISSTQAIKNSLDNIPHYIGVNLNTLFTFNSNSYIVSFIGNFGWLDTPLPYWIVISFYAILALYALRIEGPLFALLRLERWIIGLLCLLGLLLVFATLYFYWTAPGLNYISGLQGRYFLPLALFAVMALPRGLISFNTHAFKVIFSGLLICSLMVIAFRYYAFHSMFSIF